MTHPSGDFLIEKESPNEKQQKGSHPNKPVHALLGGLHQNIVAIPAQKVGANVFGRVSPAEPFPDRIAHLLRQGGPGFPDVFGLTDRTPEGLGDFSHLNVQLGFLDDGGSGDPRQDKVQDKSQYSAMDHNDAGWELLSSGVITRSVRLV